MKTDLQRYSIQNDTNFAEIFTKISTENFGRICIGARENVILTVPSEQIVLFIANIVDKINIRCLILNALPLGDNLKPITNALKVNKVLKVLYLIKIGIGLEGVKIIAETIKTISTPFRYPIYTR